MTEFSNGKKVSTGESDPNAMNTQSSSTDVEKKQPIKNPSFDNDYSRRRRRFGDDGDEHEKINAV